jgi:hypothetical protein
MNTKKKCLHFQSTGIVVWDNDNDKISLDDSNVVIVCMVYFLSIFMLM